MIFPKKENNLEDWLLKRFGKVLYNIYFKPYTEKFWGLDVKEIAVDWASKRITLSGFWDVMTRILIRKKKTPLTYIDEFYYPDHGIGQIFEKMAKEIEMYGGKIVTGAELISISRDQNKISEVIFMKSGSKHCIEMEYLISSIPLSNLVSIICPELSSDIVEAASSLKFRSLIFVFIIIDEEQLTANNWIYFPEKEFIFNRIIEPKNWSSKMVPSGKTSLCVEISCSFNDEIWQETDLNIYQTVMNDLAKVFNLNKETVLKYYISKKRYCYPIYDFNYKENTTQIKHELSNIKNLISIGRNGKFYYDTTIEAVKDGFRAASRVQALIEK